ncbi:hypothetical protein V6N13_087496 [Hibiscus sabdariffa]|uniref:Uncharacterized protein n=1 Tax=Hibiscus sabdariffa TaxID=183260 RepID=A0ABR2FX04_9ROSI
MAPATSMEAKAIILYLRARDLSHLHLRIHRCSPLVEVAFSGLDGKEDVKSESASTSLKVLPPSRNEPDKGTTWRGQAGVKDRWHFSTA